MKIALIGLGVIGQSQLKFFGDQVCVTYDPKFGYPYPAERIADCDFAVICVPTPQGDDGSADLSMLHEALDQLPEGKPALVRSTIPPGTTAKLAEERLAVHVPEFMYENGEGLWPGSVDVPFVVLGGAPEAREFFLPALPDAVYQCSGLEAELIKYTANTYLATKVTFVNEIAGICEALGANWEHVRRGWLRDPRAGISHTEVIPPGGFGGKCFPKDLSALIKTSGDAGYDPGFLRSVQDANSKFRKISLRICVTCLPPISRVISTLTR